MTWWVKLVPALALRGPSTHAVPGASDARPGCPVCSGATTLFGPGF